MTVAGSLLSEAQTPGCVVYVFTDTGQRELGGLHKAVESLLEVQMPSLTSATGFRYLFFGSWR